MSPISDIARKTMIQGETITLALLGGESALYADSLWPRSTLFGDIAELLLANWPDLREPGSAYKSIEIGLRENSDRDAFRHALEAIAATPPPDLRPIVVTLDKRVRDENTNELLRADSASALLRFSIADSRWQATAEAAIDAIEDVRDEYALSLVLRLAAVAWEHFRTNALIGLLERHAEHSQAAYERGVIGIAQALERNDVADIREGLADAESWLEKAAAVNADRRDAHVYLLLTRALNSLAANKPAPTELTDQLREEATMRYLWDTPAAGTEWLLPPHEAELQWIPLVDNVVAVSQRLAEPSWLDVSSALAQTVRMYLSVRSVRPGMPGIERAVQPAIEAAFIQERGLLAHLTQWIDRNPGDISASDAETLRDNIERRRRGREGK